MPTTEIDLTDVQRALHLKREIDRRLNVLVKEACQTVDDTGVAGRDSKMERSQFDNVLAVATETGSVEVLKNFIRYQIGRRDGLGWRHGGFGLKVVEDLDRLRDIAEEVAKESGTDVDEAWIDLARQYLGYMRRHFVYARWQAEGGQ